jgi:hypothetical protein
VSPPSIALTALESPPFEDEVVLPSPLEELLTVLPSAPFDVLVLEVLPPSPSPSPVTLELSTFEDEPPHAMMMIDATLATPPSRRPRGSEGKPIGSSFPVRAVWRDASSPFIGAVRVRALGS